MLLKLLIAALIIALLIKNAGIRKENFYGLNMRWIAAAWAVILMQNILTGIRWLALMRSIGLRVTLFDGISLTMQGLFYTLFIPGGSVSGDVIKAALIAAKTPDGGKFDAVFSVLIDRVCGLCGLFLLTLIAAVVTLVLPVELGEMLHQLLWLTVIIAPLALLAAVAAFRCDLILRIPLIKKLYDLCDRISKGALSRVEAALAAYRPAWKTVLSWTLISGLIAFPLIALSV